MKTLKKLTFSEVKNSDRYQLNPQEMSSLMGGSGGNVLGNCAYFLPGNDVIDESANCISSMEHASGLVADGQAKYWCCDSCKTTSWWIKHCSEEDLDSGGGEIPSGGPEPSGGW